MVRGNPHQKFFLCRLYCFLDQTLTLFKRGILRLSVNYLKYIVRLALAIAYIGLTTIKLIFIYLLTMTCIDCKILLV